MNTYIGIIPDENSKVKMKKAIAHVAMAFESQNVPVQFYDPNLLSVVLVPLGRNTGVISRKVTAFKMRKYHFYTFPITINSVKLGLTKRDRGVVSPIINGGAEELRNTLLDVSTLLGIKREKIFIPHIAVGRVVKDVSDQEFKNISQDLSMFSKEFFAEEMRFEAKFLALYENSENGQTVFKNF